MVSNIISLLVGAMFGSIMQYLKDCYETCQLKKSILKTMNSELEASWDICMEKTNKIISIDIKSIKIKEHPTEQIHLNNQCLLAYYETVKPYLYLIKNHETRKLLVKSSIKVQGLVDECVFYNQLQQEKCFMVNNRNDNPHQKEHRLNLQIKEQIEIIQAEYSACESVVTQLLRDIKNLSP